jgi:Tfp pilus assembly protein PilN
MIQFNLLPDVKKEYIKAKRQKRQIITMSSLVSIAVVVIVFLLFSYVQFAQKKSINDLTKDIEKEVAKTKSVQGLDEILNIQNQLNTIPGLFNNKVESSRIIDYIKTVTPKGVFITQLKVDVVNSTMEINGNSSTLALINTFADSLKFASYTNGADITNGVPFTNIYTDSFRNETKTTYGIKLAFDPVLLDNNQEIVLVVPNTITTRSVTGQPDLTGSSSENGSDALFIEEQETGEN